MSARHLVSPAVVGARLGWIAAALVATLIFPVTASLGALDVRAAFFVDFDRATGRYSLVDLARARLPVADVWDQRFWIEATQALVGDLRSRTLPTDPIFVYPSTPLVYVMAGRANATQWSHLYPGAATPTELETIVADLERRAVPVVVWDDFWVEAWGKPEGNRILTEYVWQHYAEAAKYGPFRVLTRLPR